jgi:ribosomal protein S1
MAKEPTEKAAEEKEAPKKTAAKKKTTKTAEKKATAKTPAKKTAAKTTTKKATTKKAAPKKGEQVETPEVTAAVEEVETPVAETTEDVAVVEDQKEKIEDTQKAQAEFLDNFNWHNYQEGIDVIDEKQLDEFEKLVKENFVDTADEDVIEGTVVYMTEREAIIDINAKSEGVISLNEFRYNPDLKVGDKVEVIVDTREDRTGQLVLSHRKARVIKAWDRVNNAHDNSEIVSGFVKCRTKGGMIVDVFGIEAFLPGSQIDVKPIRDYDQYVNKTMEFKVVKINHEFKNVVVKQLSAHPWDQLSDELKEGDRVKGKVVVIADYGAFVEIEEGVEGLVHVSEMSWSTHLRSAQDFVKVGDEVEAVILTLDRESRKMSLGIKQITPDPWTDITSKYPIGSKHKGLVRNFTNFGVFIELEEGIDGLVYISDLSWTKKVKHPSEVLTLGDKIDVIVLELDVEGRKLSLGHKHTKDNPWDKYEKEFALDTEHEASITEVVDKGATIHFNEDIVAFVPSRHMEKEDGSKLSKGEAATFKIIEFNKEFKRVVASHTVLFKDQEMKNVKRASAKVAASNSEKATLGDLDALASLKDKMEKDE